MVQSRSPRILVLVRFSDDSVDMRYYPNNWAIHVHRGLWYLSRHNAGDALKCFCSALETCPVSRSRELSKLLFFLGVALKRLGYSNSAIKSWNSSLRLVKSGYIRKILCRYSNRYGMVKQRSPEEDDRQAFYGIQLKRYLAGKSRRCFSSFAERDMIRDLIQTYWEDIKLSKILENESPEEKCRIFRNIEIVFPAATTYESFVPVNFFTGKRVALEDRCLCGSGLSFLECCGRIPGEDELETGIF